MKQFWETENVSFPHETQIVRTEDQLAVKKVESSLKYDQMYRVSIPCTNNRLALPGSLEMRLNSLRNTEKWLKSSLYVLHANSKCIDQYIVKRYVKKIQANNMSTSKWYIPHFSVLRPDKDTTRIVFDASARYDGQSLNDVIYQGPNLQQDSFEMLLSFRRRPVAVVCDIADMYLRIGIAPEDKPFKRFL